MRNGILLFAVSLILSGCGMDGLFKRGAPESSGGGNGATCALSEAYFTANIATVIATKCSACHASGSRSGCSYFATRATNGTLTTNATAGHNGGTAWSAPELAKITSWANGATE